MPFAIAAFCFCVTYKCVPVQVCVCFCTSECEPGPILALTGSVGKSEGVAAHACLTPRPTALCHVCRSSKFTVGNLHKRRPHRFRPRRPPGSRLESPRLVARVSNYSRVPFVSAAHSFGRFAVFFSPPRPLLGYNAKQSGINAGFPAAALEPNRLNGTLDQDLTSSESVEGSLTSTGRHSSPESTAAKSMK